MKGGRRGTCSKELCQRLVQERFESASGGQGELKCKLKPAKNVTAGNL